MAMGLCAKNHYFDGAKVRLNSNTTDSCCMYCLQLGIDTLKEHRKTARPNSYPLFTSFLKAGKEKEQIETPDSKIVKNYTTTLIVTEMTCQRKRQPWPDLFQSNGTTEPNKTNLTKLQEINKKSRSRWQDVV